MHSLRLAAAVLPLLLSSCMLGPDFAPPETPLPAKFSEGAKQSVGDVAVSAWWNSFSDRTLNQYVATGLDKNLSVQQALERINAAAADVTITGAGGLPNLDFGASHTICKARDVTSTQNISGGQLSLTGLLDVFGQYRRSTESALASLDSAHAAVDVAKLALIKDLVSSYIDARYYQQRVSISRANLKSRQETYDLTNFQLEAGAASRLDVSQAEALVQSTIAELPSLELNFRVSAHHIATLIALPSEMVVKQLQKNEGQPVYRGKINAGIPADLIRNRPDIRQAERNLAAATAKIGVAEARLYPAITLSGSITPSYINQRGRRGDISKWSFGPSLDLPILDGGRLRANVETSKSAAAAAYISWKSTVLTAVQEVQDALTAVRRDVRTVNSRHRQVETTEETLRLSVDSHKDGASSLLDVLDAQRQVSSAQSSLATAIQKLAKDHVQLNVAIGGRFAAPMVASPWVEASRVSQQMQTSGPTRNSRALHCGMF
ncbi:MULTISPECIES: efflux transporter outer membrane subunit [Rhizobium]|uniref:Efflux transporter outer membrane subunit n=1 Tax=Rhizobium indicum TaxID=2583231 RepID=A0ABX6PR89_9HYPH|nr:MULTISPECIES: efflux transporter outer membrane subunit [Rhizobium]NEI65696.1 efflux transporter outer membrane subunit [Rhizobium leguminosarum]NKL24477.1 efflux transporter outer membrane subunit [Rhizobium leguminosarum bv. viciae]NKL39240.1 efflux transporter outer membrane subunit [Rhizobium leguminosarum bv. viciae]NKL59754.1 efflux transporter outer membrane subunit [Rhizobium leguminosarum bv. viciae]QKK21202.1 efflux transporter outer membrane subunit [Rhizobium indicum]